jgi:hypothetical protein
LGAPIERQHAINCTLELVPEKNIRFALRTRFAMRAEND